MLCLCAERLEASSPVATQLVQVFCCGLFPARLLFFVADVFLSWSVQIS